MEFAFGQWANLKNTLWLGSRCRTNSHAVTILLHDDFDTAWAAKLQGDIKWHIGRNMLPDEVVLLTYLEEEHQNSYLELRIGLLMMVVPQSYLVSWATRLE